MSFPSYGSMRREEFDPLMDLRQHEARQERIRGLAEQAHEADRPGLSEALTIKADREQALRDQQEAGRNAGRSSISSVETGRTDQQRSTFSREARSYSEASIEAGERVAEADAALEDHPYADEAEEIINGEREVEAGPEQALRQHQEPENDQQAERRPSDEEMEAARHTMRTVNPFGGNGEGLRARMEAYKTIQRGEQAAEADRAQGMDRDANERHEGRDKISDADLDAWSEADDYAQAPLYDEFEEEEPEHQEDTRTEAVRPRAFRTAQHEQEWDSKHVEKGTATAGQKPSRFDGPPQRTEGQQQAADGYHRDQAAKAEKTRQQTESNPAFQAKPKPEDDQRQKGPRL